VDGQVHRRHQEDLCQILGLPPEAKYAEPPMKPGKPSWDRLATILLERALDPTGERLRLLEQMTVTIAVGNADAHAKNLSVIHERGGLVSLAPMYDLVPTLAFIPRQTRAALPVAGKFRMDEITVEHLVREAVSWSIPERRARGTVLGSLDALRSGISSADAAVPQIDPGVRGAVLAQLEQLHASAT
jgi:serine/threonine-protein kinase HipA